MSDVGLALRQIHFTNRSFWRNRAAAFFTFVFPLMLLAIFAVLFGNGSVRVGPGRSVRASTFYVPAITAFAVISACYTNLAMMVTIHREQGILKRVRGTPMPAWTYLSARVAHAVLVAFLMAGIFVAFGAAAYGASVPLRTLTAFAVTLIVGAASFCALGLAVTAAIPNADAVSPIVNASILPLLFFSNVFIPLQHAPAWVDVVGKIFPVRHFADALVASYTGAPGSGFRGMDLLVLGIWGLGGLLLAVRFFAWEPRA